MDAPADTRELRLLNEFQRAFPLEAEPYAVIAQRLDADEDWVRGTLAARVADGTVSRIGAVFRPGTIGASTLAAMAVPPAALDRVAASVSARREVNHNYEREHRLNLWFVVAATDRAAVDAVLAGIARDAGTEAFALPLVRDYEIDLGFDLSTGATGRMARAGTDGFGATRATPKIALTATDRRLVAALERGLPLVARPYRALGDAAGLDEREVLDRLAAWLGGGVIARLGVVVRHRRLGFVANAMCVWDVPDENVDALGVALAREPGVTLCYRRERAQPDWRYNLFLMIHGRERDSVQARRAALEGAHALHRFPTAVLFSRRAFKQCGARYAADAPASEPVAA